MEKHLFEALRISREFAEPQKCGLMCVCVEPFKCPFVQSTTKDGKSVHC